MWSETAALYFLMPPLFLKKCYKNCHLMLYLTRFSIGHSTGDKHVYSPFLLLLITQRFSYCNPHSFKQRFHSMPKALCLTFICKLNTLTWGDNLGFKSCPGTLQNGRGDWTINLQNSSPKSDLSIICISHNKYLEGEGSEWYHLTFRNG